VEVAERALAGETLPLRFAWRDDAAGMEDHIQFLRRGHEASGMWRVYDLPPTGPPLLDNRVALGLVLNL